MHNYLITFFVLLVLELLYFRVAIKYRIIDVPNHRSLHSKFTIRGGGIIFFLAYLSYTILFGSFSYYILAGLSIITVISFVDDMRTLTGRTRLVFQFLAAGLMMWQLFLSTGIALYWLFPVLILTVGIVNAFNFMDGINGITGGYSLVTMGSLWYINRFIVEFAPESLFVVIIISLLIFNFFNFRNKAVCFAGDVGSISIAFIIIYLILSLIIKTGNPLFILLLAVYGVDSVLTIVHRLIRKENIFLPHRIHFFQIAVYHGKQSHLTLSIIYMIVQLSINALIVLMLGAFNVHIQYGIGILVLGLLTISYLYFKYYFFGKGWWMDDV